MAYEERSDQFTEGEHSLAGYQVYDRHYEKVGKVDDLFVDEDDRPEYIGVKTGFLGTKTALIPIEIARVNDRRQLVEVAADGDTVKEGPTFGDDREITSEFERRVLSYYRVETEQASTERGPYGAYYSDATGDERTGPWLGERAETSERSGEERPGAAMGDVERERRSALDDGDELRVQRSEEELRAGTREREAGAMRVRKRVRTDRERVRVPKKREEVHAERVPVEGQEVSEAEIGDDEIRVPVIEEEVVVERRPVVKEEIRLRKEVIEDEEIVEEDVRKEEVDIEDQTERTGTRERTEEADETRHSLPEETQDKMSSEDRHGADDREKESSKKEARTHPPFEGYDDLTIKEAKKKVDGLSEGELEKVRSYEKEHKNRKTLIEQLDRKLGDAS